MTYCLGLINRFGIVMGADSRTNAGVDYISAYRKLFDFSVTGERVIILCTSGNLSVSQGVINQIKRDLRSEEEQTLHTLMSMNDVAHYIGTKVRQIQDRDRLWLEQDKIDYHCSFLLGGQIRGEEPQLFLIYPREIIFRQPKKPLSCRLAKRNMASPYWIAPLPTILL